MLHCSHLPGMTVEQAIPVLQDLGVRVIWRSSDRSIDDASGIDPATIGGQIVQANAAAVSPGVVDIWVSPGRIPPSVSDPDSWPEFNQGC